MCVDGACSGPSVPPIAGETDTINQPYVYTPHTSDAPQLFSHLPAGVPRWRSLKKTSQRKDENNVPKSSRDTPAVLPGGRPHGPGRSRRTLRYQQRVHARRRHTATNDSGCRDDRCAARGRCLCQSRRRRTRSKRVRFTYNMHLSHLRRHVRGRVLAPAFSHLALESSVDPEATTVPLERQPCLQARR